MSEENPTPELETPATPAPPAPGSPEYNAQLAAEGQIAMGQVPQKFMQEDGSVNVEAMAKAYAELEKQFHQPKADAAEATPVQEEAPAEEVKAPVEELRVPDAPEPEETVVEEASKSVVTDEEMSGFVQEIMAGGDIAPESRTNLLERGIPESLINSMVEGHRARMQQQFKAAGEIVGGDQRLNEIFNWAANNLDEAQRSSINTGLAGTASEATLLGLAAMYDKAKAATPKAAEPREAPRYGSNPAGRASVQPYGSKAEMYADLGKPEMNRDPKFTAMVKDRMTLTRLETLQ